MRLVILVLLLISSALVQAQEFVFIENRGQWPESVFGKFNSSEGDVYVEEGGVTYHFMDLSEWSSKHANPNAPSTPPSIKGHVLRVGLVGGHTTESIAIAKKKTKYNYFLGNDPTKWGRNCSSYSGTILKEVYTGINLSFYAKDFALKYDFIVEAGANPDLIRLKYEGADELYIENGRLVSKLSVGTLVEQQPIAYQEIAGERQRIACEYALIDNELRFVFPNGYNMLYPLTIDPELIFSTYSGSTSDNFGYTAAFDDEGFLYSGSSAFGSGYPTTTGAYQTTWAGGDGQGFLAGTDIAVSKYDTTGTFMVYSTFLGGPNDDLPHSLIVNDDGELLMLGTSSSPLYPTTSDAVQTTFLGGPSIAPEGVGVEYVNGCDIVLTKLSASGGSLVGSTFLGGSGNDGVVNPTSDLKFNYADEFRGEVELDGEGNVYVASSTLSDDFPTENAIIPNAQGNLDGVLVKLNEDLSDILWSTYYGGSEDDACYSLALTSQNEVVCSGGTVSIDLPGMSNGYQDAYQGGIADGFIIEFSEDGSEFNHGTYVGSTSYDQAYFVELDDFENVHIYGQSLAGGTEWIINADYANPNSGMIITKL
ncbi:MAG: hypothetical protein AAF193_02680, partial [Bacteroidota bacterium]